MLAVNRLLAARDEAAFTSFISARKGELDVIAERHAAEKVERSVMLEREGAKAHAALRQRLRAAAEARMAETRATEAEAAENSRAREAKRVEARAKEVDREVWRAQVYAINKLMAMRDASSFADFEHGRGSSSAVEDADLASATPTFGSSSVQLAKRATSSAGTASSSFLSPALARVASCRSAEERPLCANTGGGGRNATLSRTWGHSGEREAAKRESTEERDAALVERLARPREDMSDEAARECKRKGTIRQQQRAEEAARLAKREKHREEVKTRDAEREQFRAQVYAINRLMRAREDAAFEAFRLQRSGETAPRTPLSQPSTIDDAKHVIPNVARSKRMRPRGPMASCRFSEKRIADETGDASAASAKQGVCGLSGRTLVDLSDGVAQAHMPSLKLSTELDFAQAIHAEGTLGLDGNVLLPSAPGRSKCDQAQIMLVIDEPTEVHDDEHAVTTHSMARSPPDSMADSGTFMPQVPSHGVTADSVASSAPDSVADGQTISPHAQSHTGRASLRGPRATRVEQTSLRLLHESPYAKGLMVATSSNVPTISDAAAAAF